MGYSLIREYVILTVTYSLVAAVLIELLLRFWRIESSGTRIKFRLLILLFPPPLALLYPFARAIPPVSSVVKDWKLLDTGALVTVVNVYLPWLWYLVIAALATTAAHFALQVLIPVCQRRSGSASEAERPPDPKLLRAYASVSRATGLSPRFLLTEREQPAAEVRGLFSPSVVVSSALIQLLDEEELETVLAHEFAHIEHAGIALNWFSTILRILMFYNPLAALVHTLIALDAERHCDDAAVAAVPKPLAFASALIKIHRASARRAPRHFPARVSASLAVRVAAWGNHALHSFTIERIRRMLNPKSFDEDTLARLRQGMAGAALATILFFVT